MKLIGLIIDIVEIKFIRITFRSRCVRTPTQKITAKNQFISFYWYAFDGYYLINHDDWLNCISLQSFLNRISKKRLTQTSVRKPNAFIYFAMKEPVQNAKLKKSITFRFDLKYYDLKSV